MTQPYRRFDNRIIQKCLFCHKIIEAATGIRIKWKKLMISRQNMEVIFLTGFRLLFEVIDKYLGYVGSFKTS